MVREFAAALVQQQDALPRQPLRIVRITSIDGPDAEADHRASLERLRSLVG